MNSRGFSLMEALMAMMMIGILFLITASANVNLQRQNRAMSEKLSALYLGRVISNVLRSPSACSGIFSKLHDAAAMPFNATGISPTNPKRLSIDSIPGTKVVAGQPASANSESLILMPATASNPGIEVLVTSTTSATLKINFDSSKMVQPIQNLVFPNVRLKPGGSLIFFKIDGCN